ncbi:alpha-mannosidase [Bifidobacterium olomucense]|uniref:Alpha-mannosidase n=1 Tax=Bifidobacterium olomucense TaxID=2675324 RepID=A0A7Y0EXV2_9BIFI|nr:alpha-mannosidase [Bifidobacterium sp. DSM 109959]NMM98379.1 alpha-mannosidase [Bifidobacterium sp. DSM 109959]
MILKPQQQVERCKRVMKERIEPRIHPVLSHCNVQAFANQGEPEPADEFLARAELGEVPFESVPFGEPWGTSWGTTWFKVQGHIPVEEARGRAIELEAHLGFLDGPVGGQVEGLVYRPDGTVIKGLHPRNHWAPLISADGKRDAVIDDNGDFTLYVEGAYNPMIPAFPQTTWGAGPTGRADVRYEFHGIDVCAYEHELAEYYMDLDAVSMAIEQVDHDSPRYWKLAKALQRSLNRFDMRDLSTVAAARQALDKAIHTPTGGSALHLAAIGHAHIDSAWLWPTRETKRKVARTVSNALSLMDQNPDYLYAMSSAQQYAWLEEAHPDLFARMKQRIQEGRFIPVGAMWVESDGMLPSGESLIRQISYGKRYYREHLGCDTKVIWLPDSFGYTGSFPQIAKRAGYEYFLTQKISWNDTTRLPHHSFMWEGIDGSRIFTHFPPADTYGAEVSAKELTYAEHNYKDKDISSSGALLFGYGDGGGGVTREMAGRVTRYRDFDGMPHTEYQAPEAFFSELKQEIAREAGDEFPVWKGELYLELHRATLTAQQEMKRGCRQTESLLRTAEYLGLLASLVDQKYEYPRTQLDAIWKTLLLNQFHDILPGSGIAWLYTQARAEYTRDMEALHNIIDAANAVIRRALPDAPVIGSGKIVPFAAPLPAANGASQWATVPNVSGNADPVSVRNGSDGSIVLDNGLMSATIESDGTISSLWDAVAQREIVPSGTRLGRYELLKDEPSVFDAWDIERDAFLTAHTPTGGYVESVATEKDGTASVNARLTFGSSAIETTISLRPGIRQLDFHAHVAWHTQEQFLKVDIPTNIIANRATYDCQYGTIERPVVKNTLRDEAMFENCSHRFIHVSEPGYAVGVVNGSTYGSDTAPLQSDGHACGTMVRLSLLSGPCAPDPQADQGDHDFNWSVVPSDGMLPATIAAAYMLNAPAITDLVATLPPVALEITQGTPIIDWMKLADDGSGDLIVRVYEATGAPAAATLHVNSDLLGPATIVETNELEEIAHYDGEPVALVTDEIHPDDEQYAEGAQLVFGPYQLATLRIHRAN